MEIGISRSGARERPARDGSRPWRSASLDLVRERDRLGVGRVVQVEAGSGWLEVAGQELGREQSQRKRAEAEKEKRERE